MYNKNAAIAAKKQAEKEALDKLFEIHKAKTALYTKLVNQQKGLLKGVSYFSLVIILIMDFLYFIHYSSLASRGRKYLRNKEEVRIAYQTIGRYNEIGQG